mgnify:CR=1 FL=1
MHTSHAGNVGAAARAIKVMGFADLVLVRPRFDDVLHHDEALAMASGADDVLAKARIVDDLAAALDGVQQVWATAMTPRDFGPPVFAPRERLPLLAGQGQSVAFVFGGERFGLSNDDVYRCHGCLSIPTAPGYGSLNLAQAVQVLAYEWRLALGGYEVVARTGDPELADAADVQATLAHWQQALVDVGFLDPESPKRPMPRLYAYVRVALGPAASERLADEGGRYDAIPAYHAHFVRMGVKPVDTAIAATSADGIKRALAAWEGAVDEVVLRAITAKDTVEDHLTLVRAAG